MSSSDSTLVREILAGERPDLLRLAARGLVPLPLDELVSLQVRLTDHPEGQVALDARQALDSMEPKVLAGVLGRVPGSTLRYFAAHARHPLVLEALLRRRDTPLEMLVELAPRLLEDLQEILLLRQDAIIEQPEILEALESNPDLSSFARRRIREYREHLLPRQKEPVEEAEEPEDGDEPTDQEVQEEIVRAQTETTASGEMDEDTGLSETQIRNLSIPVRLKLARGASRSLRGILVRDPNPQVAVAAIKNAPVSEQEVELYCHNRSISEDVLEEIARRREWVRKPTIVYALVQNPRTPQGTAVRFVSRLSVRQLRDLSRNRNVPEAVRATAARLYKIKRQ